MRCWLSWPKTWKYFCAMRSSSCRESSPGTRFQTSSSSRFRYSCWTRTSWACFLRRLLLRAEAEEAGGVRQALLVGADVELAACLFAFDHDGGGDRRTF